MYNSIEERAAIHALARNEDVPGVVVGVGSMIPAAIDAARARQAFALSRPFLLYVGRIEENKGCAELFDYFLRYLESSRRDLDLVLIGTAAMPMPAHPRIRHLGFVSDRDKFDVLSGADALVIPSYFESLSMVALEAWALGRPVLANGRCDVLQGQCVRSNAGLYYESAGDFTAALDRLLEDRELAEAMGRNGREYFARHYSWPVIERKYLEMFERLSSSSAGKPMEPLPGWFARRRPTVPAALDVLANLPSGPAPEYRGEPDKARPTVPA
jgi:glycosyltransferase involved in cell wall biosynthesis